MTIAHQHRILKGQATGSKARQALMIAANELRINGFAYREGYQLADEAQRASLTHTLRTEFNAQFPLPEQVDAGVSLVFYLIVLDGEPVLLPEEDVVPAVFGIVLARAGVEAARRVSYRDHMLPEPTK